VVLCRGWQDYTQQRDECLGWYLADRFMACMDHAKYRSNVETFVMVGVMSITTISVYTCTLTRPGRIFGIGYGRFRDVYARFIMLHAGRLIYTLTFRILWLSIRIEPDHVPFFSFLWHLLHRA
jgi:type IV secretory pathway VirB3-like protein